MIICDLGNQRVALVLVAVIAQRSGSLGQRGNDKGGVLCECVMDEVGVKWGNVKDEEVDIRVSGAFHEKSESKPNK